MPKANVNVQKSIKSKGSLTKFLRAQVPRRLRDVVGWND